MITDIQIKNFKCFKNLIVPELGRITLISGRNNVGKTALLEALFLFLDQRNPAVVLNQYSRRGIGKILLTTEAIWNPIFCDNAKDKETGIKEISWQLNLDLKEICYIGDVRRDIPALKLVGLGLCPFDGDKLAKEAADQVLSACGGRGAVAETSGR